MSELLEFLTTYRIAVLFVSGWAIMSIFQWFADRADNQYIRDFGLTTKPRKKETGNVGHPLPLTPKYDIEQLRYRMGNAAAEKAMDEIKSVVDKMPKREQKKFWDTWERGG